MQESHITLVQSSWKKVLPIRVVAAELFYTKLFELDPKLRSLFKGDINEQGVRLMSMIGTAVAGLQQLEALIPAVQQLGIRHAGYGVKDEHYETVKLALLDTLQKGLGDAFTAQVKTAWVEVYQVLTSTMKAAAAKN